MLGQAFPLFFRQELLGFGDHVPIYRYRNVIGACSECHRYRKSWEHWTAFGRGQLLKGSCQKINSSVTALFCQQKRAWRKPHKLFTFTNPIQFWKVEGRKEPFGLLYFLITVSAVLHCHLRPLLPFHQRFHQCSIRLASDWNSFSLNETNYTLGLIYWSCKNGLDMRLTWPVGAHFVAGVSAENLSWHSPPQANGFMSLWKANCEDLCPQSCCEISVPRSPNDSHVKPGASQAQKSWRHRQALDTKRLNFGLCSNGSRALCFHLSRQNEYHLTLICIWISVHALARLSEALWPGKCTTKQQSNMSRMPSPVLSPKPATNIIGTPHSSLSCADSRTTI